MDTPAGQIRDGVVDLIEGIPLGHQRLQVELAADVCMVARYARSSGDRKNEVFTT